MTSNLFENLQMMKESEENEVISVKIICELNWYELINASNDAPNGITITKVGVFTPAESIDDIKSELKSRYHFNPNNIIFNITDEENRGNMFYIVKGEKTDIEKYIYDNWGYTLEDEEVSIVNDVKERLRPSDPKFESWASDTMDDLMDKGQDEWDDDDWDSYYYIKGANSEYDHYVNKQYESNNSKNDDKNQKYELIADASMEKYSDDGDYEGDFSNEEWTDYIKQNYNVDVTNISSPINYTTVTYESSDLENILKLVDKEYRYSDECDLYETGIDHDTLETWKNIYINNGGTIDSLNTLFKKYLGYASYDEAYDATE